MNLIIARETIPVWINFLLQFEGYSKEPLRFITFSTNNGLVGGLTIGGTNGIFTYYAGLSVEFFLEEHPGLFPDMKLLINYKDLKQTIEEIVDQDGTVLKGIGNIIYKFNENEKELLFVIDRESRTIMGEHSIVSTGFYLDKEDFTEPIFQGTTTKIPVIETDIDSCHQKIQESTSTSDLEEIKKIDIYTEGIPFGIALLEDRIDENHTRFFNEEYKINEEKR